MTVSRPPHDIQPTYTEQYDLCFHWDISCSGLPHSNFYFHQFLFVLNVEKRHQNVCWHQENYTDIHSFHPCGAFESYVMPLCNRCEVNSELQNNWYKTNRPLNQTNVTGVWNECTGCLQNATLKKETTLQQLQSYCTQCVTSLILHSSGFLMVKLEHLEEFLIPSEFIKCKCYQVKLKAFILLCVCVRRAWSTCMQRGKSTEILRWAKCDVRFLFFVFCSPCVAYFVGEHIRPQQMKLADWKNWVSAVTEKKM